MIKIFFLIFVTISSLTVAQSVTQLATQNDYLLAENYYREGAYEKATQLFEKLYKFNNFNTRYLGRLISCYQETSKFLIVEQLLQNRIKKNETEAFLYVFLGYNFARQLKPLKAQHNYAIAIKYLEHNSAYTNIVGQLFKEYSLLDLAILTYEKAMLQNKNTNYNFQIAQIYGEQGNYKKMFEAYIDLVDKNADYLNLVQRYSSAYITDNSENEINIIFKKTLLRRAVSAPKAVWNVLLSWLFTQQKEYTKALLQEKALFSRIPNDLNSFFTLGKIAFDSADFEASKECFHFIITTSLSKEKLLTAHLFLVKIAIATKDPATKNLFLNLYETFGVNAGTIELQVEYADFLTYQENQAQEATVVLKTALSHANSKFDQARIKMKLGDVLVFIGKYNNALIYFSQIQTELKDHELAQEARFKVAQTSYFRGDFEWAKAQLKVLKGSTTQLIANDALALYLKIADNEPVDSIPSGLTQLANAELLAFQNKTDTALQELDKLFKTNGVFVNGLIPSEVIYDDVLFLQSKLLLKKGDYQKAIQNLFKIIDADPQTFLADTVYYMIAETYDTYLKDQPNAQKYYKKIIFEYPASIYMVDARKKYRQGRGDSL